MCSGADEGRDLSASLRLHLSPPSVPEMKAASGGSHDRAVEP